MDMQLFRLRQPCAFQLPLTPFRPPARNLHPAMDMQGCATHLRLCDNLGTSQLKGCAHFQLQGQPCPLPLVFPLFR